MWTAEEIGHMIRDNTHFTIVCGPVVDIGPSLDLWHCFPLSGCRNFHLDDFTTYQEIVATFRTLFDRYRGFGISGACMECKFFQRGQCTGGCLAHTLRDVHGPLTRITPERVSAPASLTPAFVEHQETVDNG
jgi:radical SAM protein with 4Fe4S-binding SPASM domain